MRVKLNTRWANGSTVYSPGDCVSVDSEIGAQLVRDGYAVSLDVAPIIERAAARVAEAIETPERSKARR